MPPTSSSSVINSPKSKDVDSTSKNSSDVNLVSRLFAQAKNALSPTKTTDHTVINDEQKNVLTFLQRQDQDSSTFTRDIDEIQQIEREKAIVISQNDMDKLKQFREDYLQKKSQKNTTADTFDDLDTQNKKRNLEWIIVLDRHIKQSNDYCVFVYERHHFTNQTTIGNTDRFFMSADAHCKFDSCTCEFHAIISENGRLEVDYSGKIVHRKGEHHARPIRGSRREELQQFPMLGATPGAVHLQQLKLLSVDNKEAGNRNVVGSSRSVIRKISSEANVKLHRDDDLDKSLRELKVEQAKKIFPGEVIPGYLQEISTDPLRL
ncbi:unnamed protein product, partial [Rotaria sp. Silwood2]